ncbi:MAG: NUDIX domain-containing protein [Thermoplasmatota archaeon]
MRFKYCPECGNELVSKEIGDEGEIPYCSVCDEIYFDSFNTCVIVTVINDDKIALVKQYRLSKNYWILIAGYVNEGETAEETVIREVWEEITIPVIECKYISSYFHDRVDNLMLGFVAFVEEDRFSTSNELDDIRWFKIDEAEEYLKEGSIAHEHFCNVKDYLNSRTQSDLHAI